MKYILKIILMTIFSTTVLANSPLDRYTDTTWERIDTDPDRHVQLQFMKSSKSSDVQSVLSIDGKVRLTAPLTTYNESTHESGIHGGQDFLALYTQADDDPVLGFFIAGEDCLLFPDTDAPEDCLKPVTEPENSLQQK